MTSESRIPPSLATLCKRRFLLEDLNKNLNQELRSLRSYVTQLDFRNARSQVAYDRIQGQLDRQIAAMQEQLEAKTNLVKSLQSYCDWWSHKWTLSHNDRQNLLQENYILRVQVQGLQLQLKKEKSRVRARSSGEAGDSMIVD